MMIYHARAMLSHVAAHFSLIIVYAYKVTQ